MNKKFPNLAQLSLHARSYFIIRAEQKSVIRIERVYIYSLYFVQFLAPFLKRDRATPLFLVLPFLGMFHVEHSPVFRWLDFWGIQLGF